MPVLSLVVPGRLDTATGGYRYDREIVARLRALGWDVDVHELDGAYPMPGPADRRAAEAVFGAVPDGRLVLVDGLAFGALPDLAARESGRLRLVALVHHPLALETGLDDQTRQRLASDERQALRAARHVVVTHQATADRLMADFGVPAARLSSVRPGVEEAPEGRGGDGPTVSLLCVATLTPRKGHDILVRALAAYRHVAWHLTLAGSLDRAPATTEAVRTLIRALGLDERVTLAGEASTTALAALYDRADLFVLATRYEGYGMVVAEALAHAVPVVATRTGGIPELVPPDAGLLVAPDDAEGFAAAMGRVLTVPTTRTALRAGARRARRLRRSWETAGTEFDGVLRRMIDG
ncbi:MAG: glycosyltransferase family 4 protein [Acidobacteria bacterium]|nr:glycosyltransferase family 4 protein [Acidobacteriota bacterium]